MKYLLICIKKSDDLVVHINVSERLSFFRKACFVGVSNIFNVPCVLHHHGAEVISFYENASSLSRFLVRYSVDHSSLNLVLGTKWECFLKSICRNCNVEVLHNAVPIHELHAASTKNDKFVISMLANLCERKGVVIALKALRELKGKGLDAHIHFIGGGDVDKYTALAEEHGVKSYCTFHGWVRSEVALQYLASSDLMILPSYDEGLPMVILEAMAQKIPVVCTPVGSIPEVFMDREDCLFIEVGNFKSLSNAMLEIGNDKILRDSLVSNAFEKYESSFSLNVYSKRLLNIYKTLIRA